MKLFSLLLLMILPATRLFGQDRLADSLNKKEGIAIGEIGPVFSTDIKSGKSNYGYGAAVETTPVENWLELELGVSSVYSNQYHETDVDFLFKKPWTFSPVLEFMFGVGPQWGHSTSQNITTNSWSGEAALDFMYWPFKKRQFGFYLEPDYVYGLGKVHEQAGEMSAGLLINIP